MSVLPLYVGDGKHGMSLTQHLCLVEVSEARCGHQTPVIAFRNTHDGHLEREFDVLALNYLRWGSSRAHGHAR